MKFRNLVVAAAGSLPFEPLTSFAQITAIEGNVNGPEGGPLVKGLVKIMRTDIKGNYKCNTNKKGHYFYNGLPLGTYNIAVEIDGKEMDGVNGVRTRLGDPVPINFDLQKIAQQNAAKAASATAAAASGTAPALSKEQERGMTKEQKEAYDKAIKDREGVDEEEQGTERRLHHRSGRYPGEGLRHRHHQPDQGQRTRPQAGRGVGAVGRCVREAASKKTGPEFDATWRRASKPMARRWNSTRPTPPRTTISRSRLRKAKKFPEMQAELQKAAELDPPKAGQYYYNLGALLVNAGQAEPAGAAFKKAIELDPEPRRFLLSVRRLPGRQGVLRGRWESDAGPRHGRSLPEVPGTRPHRPVRRFGKGHADLDGCEGGHAVQEPQRPRAQEEEVELEVPGREMISRPTQCFVISSSKFSFPS